MVTGSVELLDKQARALDARRAFRDTRTRMCEPTQPSAEDVDSDAVRRAEAYQVGQRAKRDGEGIGSNPYAGSDGSAANAREWLRVFLDDVVSAGSAQGMKEEASR
jgi:hypothetical protein